MPASTLQEVCEKRKQSEAAEAADYADRYSKKQPGGCVAREESNYIHKFSVREFYIWRRVSII